MINASIRDAPIKLNNYLKLEAYLYNMYSCVISNSIAGLKSYKQNKRTGRHVVYNGFNFNRIPKISKFNLRDNLELNNKFIITMVGSMGVRKDQNIFIKASNIVLEKSPEVLFILIGDGPKRTEYEKFVNQLNLNNNVIFLGILENVESYLKASDISVLTSSKLHGEGIPNVVMESFACGTPVIATDNGGTCEIVKNDVNGYLINVNNHNELAAKILYLKNNPDILKRFSFNGKNIIKEKFSSEVMIKNLRNVLDC